MTMCAGAAGAREKALLKLELQAVMGAPNGCWELNPGPLQEQRLILAMEASLQSLCLFLKTGSLTELTAHQL